MSRSHKARVLQSFVNSGNPGAKERLDAHLATLTRQAKRLAERVTETSDSGGDA